VVDLTHPANVALFRRWDQAEAAYVQMLRFVRISSAHPATAVVSRVGKHVTLTAPVPAPADAMDEDDGEAPALLPAA
jgi:translation machinery-associated protein 16